MHKPIISQHLWVWGKRIASNLRLASDTILRPCFKINTYRKINANAMPFCIEGLEHPWSIQHCPACTTEHLCIHFEALIERSWSRRVEFSQQRERCVAKQMVELGPWWDYKVFNPVGLKAECWRKWLKVKLAGEAELRSSTGTCLSFFKILRDSRCKCGLFKGVECLE